MGCSDRAQERILKDQLACQVVPDIATYAVDDGFSYSIPPDLLVEVGSLVRVKVSGRKRRGIVTAVFIQDTQRNLLPVEEVIGTGPALDGRLLASLRWAAAHYVAPLSVLLRRTLPPNKPSPVGRPIATVETHAEHSPTHQIAFPPYGDRIEGLISEFGESFGLVVVIAPSVAEVDAISDQLAVTHGTAVVCATSSMSAASVTKTWNRISRDRDLILVGTREVMLWPYPCISLAIVVEDGRRVMKSPRTPTLNVREVLLQRSASEAFPLVFLGPVPTLEVLASAASVVAPSGRQWPQVEVVDRTEEPPGSSLLTQRAKRGVTTALAAGDTVFVLVGSRGYAPAFRCVKCGTVRRCPECSSAVSQDGPCLRCSCPVEGCPTCGGSRFQAVGAGIGRVVEDIKRIVGNRVGRPGEGFPVTVGTERDLIGVHDGGLAMAVDVDGLTMAPHYRASEDALRLLVRLAQTVRTDAARRCLIQTSLPAQPVIQCLLAGTSGAFLAEELASREKHGFPPYGSLIALETEERGELEGPLAERVSPHATLLGPAPVGRRFRWLVQGSDLSRAKMVLRDVVGAARAKGHKVRVDVDPIDL